MSIDPYTGRNPSYCFVELKTKVQADQAIQDLNGKDFLGRPIKIGPGVVSSKRQRPQSQHDRVQRGQVRPPVFDRWTRTDASDHWTRYSEEGRRLWVGGLPRMGTHDAVNDEVRRLFKGYKM